MAEGTLSLIRETLAERQAQTQAMSEARIWLEQNESSAVRTQTRSARSMGQWRWGVGDESLRSECH